MSAQPAESGRDPVPTAVPESELPWRLNVARSIIARSQRFRYRSLIRQMVQRLLGPRVDMHVVFRAPDGFLVAAYPAGRGSLPDAAFWRGHQEIGPSRFLGAYLQPDDVFYDVGANYGYYTLQAATRISGASAVVAFEPHPDTRAELARNLRLNAATNVVVREEALSDAEGEAHLFQPSGHGLAACTLASASDEAAIGPCVTVCRLDEAVSKMQLPPPTVVKIDVEGWESHALEGAKDVLAGPAPPLLVIEADECLARRAGSSVAVWARALGELGYRFLALNEYAGSVRGLAEPWECPTDPGTIDGISRNLVAYHPGHHADRLRRIDCLP